MVSCPSFLPALLLDYGVGVLVGVGSIGVLVGVGGIGVGVGVPRAKLMQSLTTHVWVAGSSGK